MLFTKKYFLLLLALVLLASVSSVHAEAPCATAFDSGQTPQAAPKNIVWRSERTNLSQSNTYIKSSKAREDSIKESVKDMEKEIKGGGTPVMFVIPADTVVENILLDGKGYGSGEVDKYEISKLGAEGIYKVSMVLPVSGHTGFDNAKKWSTTDTYSIQLQTKNGKTIDLVKNAKSLDLVTVQEVEIPLRKGEEVRLLYNRSGSMGPGGFIEGRALDLVWDGT